MWQSREASLGRFRENAIHGHPDAIHGMGALRLIRFASDLGDRPPASTCTHFGREYRADPAIPSI